MLTYRVGTSTGMASARAMATHLLEPTLPPGLAAAAAYYARTPGLAGERAGSEAFTATVPRVREDLDPRLAGLLRLDLHRAPDADAIAHLLAGRRADGIPVAGRAEQRATLSLAYETGLPADRLPTPEEVAQVLAGRHAKSGEPLPRARAATLCTRLRRLLGADEATPVDHVVAAVAQARRADGGPLRPTAYLDLLTATRAPVRFVDLCFSADKSVSLAWAFAETEAERALLHAVHREAVAETMRTIEATLGRARRGKGGRGGYEPGRMAWIALEHFTSKPTTEIATRAPKTGEAYTHLATIRTVGSPQLHTHVCCLAHVLTASGHVGAVDLSQLRGRVHEWGGLYQAHLATGLRRLGVEVHLDPKTGAARVAAVPERVRRVFSRRTAQGEAAARAYARAQGLNWDALTPARRIGLLKTGVQGDPRGVKTDDLGDLAAWRREAEALGWRPWPVSNLDAPLPLPSRSERLEIARAAAVSLLARAFTGEAVVNESAARTAAARGLVASGIEDAEEIGDVIRALVVGGIEQDGCHTAVIAHEVRGPRGETAVRLTTAAHVEQEGRLVALARAAASDRSAAQLAEEIDAAIAAANLDLSGRHRQAQGAAIRLLGSGSKLGVLLGAAGAGKSRALAPLCAAWMARGRHVHGVGWRQAPALADAGIPEERCVALATLLARVQSGSLQLGPDDVILLDEVSLSSARDALALLELREASGCALIAVGDHRQDRKVQADAVITLLSRAHDDGEAEITTTVRQRTKRERDLADLARAGRADDVLNALLNEDRARLASGTLTDAAETVAALWQERAAAVGEEGVLVVAPTREDCLAVSLAIRRRKRAAGRIGLDIAVLDAIDQAGDVYEVPVAVGDRLRLFGRTHARGAGAGLLGVNGSIVELRSVQQGGLVLRSVKGREGLVPWNILRDHQTGRIRIAPGDCSTLSASQGASSEECLVAMPRGSEGVDAGAFYVAMTRHRAKSWLVLGEGAERRAVAARRGLGDVRPIRAADLWAHAAGTFSRRPTSENALDFLDRAARARRTAEDTFRRGLARMEARTARGLVATILPAQGRRRRLAQAMGPLAARLQVRARSLMQLAAGAALMGERIARATQRDEVPHPAPRVLPGAE